MGRDSSDAISASSLSLLEGQSSSSKTSNVTLQRVQGLKLIANTPKGRGIFASEPIPAQTVIEICPVLVLNPKDAGEHISKTQLDHYTYNWPWKDGQKTQVIVLGLGSIFNHSIYDQNVAWTRDVRNECITYTALRDITIGEELCISYGSGRLWFPDADAEAVERMHQADNDESSTLNGLERIISF